MSDTLYCSFCAKSQHVVNVLIAGPTVLICDECVDMCTVIVAENRAKRRFRVTSIKDVEAVPVGEG